MLRANQMLLLLFHSGKTGNCRIYIIRSAVFIIRLPAIPYLANSFCNQL